MYSNVLFVFFAIFSLALAIPQNRNGQGNGQGPNNNGQGNNNNGANNGGNNAAGGLTLDAANVQKASDSNGNPDTAEGQAASATDASNFINFCSGKQITNGAQVTGGSCNGIVMGDIPSQGNMISSVIINPAPGQNIQANTNFDITVQISNLVAGKFTNPENTYYAAPQALQGGKIVGHCHVTVQDLGNSLTPNQPPDASKFAFFKGINDAGNGNGLLKATVTGGLPPGNYRVCTMNSASNHQPVLMPVAQRGAQDDCTKFTVGGNGGNNNGNSGNAGNAGNAGNNNGQGGVNAQGANGNANASNGQAGNGQTGNGNNGSKDASNGNRSNSGTASAGSNAGNAGNRSSSAAASSTISSTTTTSSAAASGNANANGGRQQSVKDVTTTTFTTLTDFTTVTAAAAAQTASTGDTNRDSGFGGNRFGGDNNGRNRFATRGHIAV